MDEIPAPAWDALATGGQPFVRHAFLAALEHHGCVGERFGWLPRHLTLHEAGRLVAALPLYAKDNSYGEFVFDHAWAEAYRRAGSAYFPKLVSAVPYTPIGGPRLLVEAGREAELRPRLVAAALEFARAEGASGLHALFPAPGEHDALAAAGLHMRHDCQFHWHNRGYRDFDAFLATLTAKRRKTIRQERRRVADAGVTFRLLDGHTASGDDWHDFERFYRNTFESKWGVATLNAGFFAEVAARLPEQVVLVMADLEGSPIAGALMYRDGEALYGRHWGRAGGEEREVDGLHFETCYYRGIDYCIAHGLRRFEPGAQGEHKLPRGFLPTLTRSAHWLADPRFHALLGDFAARERRAVAAYMAELEPHSPYRQEPVS